MGDIFFGGMAAAAAAREAADHLRRTSDLTARANLVATELGELRDQVERLTLLNQALWELLRDRVRLTDADLEKKAQEVDLRDGVLDGKMTKHPLRCPNCSRVSNSRHRKCLYCGLEFQGDVFG